MLPACAVRAATEPLPSNVARVFFGEERHQVSPILTGFNTSYFNDLDVVWETGNVEERLREIRAGALRYPGGEETSRFHWEHPGVDGYIDLWNPELHDQQWQSVRVGRANWDRNELFVDLDKFVARCVRIGAEPIVGVNMTSGEVMNRRADGIAEAVRLAQRIVERGYPVRYLYMDNEPWHPGYYLFPGDTYAEVYVEYARAIRQVAPHLKFIASPNNQPRFTPHLETFLRLAGDYTDYLNLHFYWGGGRPIEERWKRSRPMITTSAWKWIEPENTRTYTEYLKRLRAQLAEKGQGRIGLTVLEWNIALPKEPEPSIPPAVRALAQGEMFLQIAGGDAHIACMWPMFWQVEAPPGLEGGVSYPPTRPRRWRGLFEMTPPYRPTPGYEVFRLLKDLPGSRWVDASSSDPAVIVSAARDGQGALHAWVLNKSGEIRTVALEKVPDGRLEVAGSIDEAGNTGGAVATGPFSSSLPPWSLTHLRVLPR
ncbi:hypothetical protein OPIT5_12430 [Opitutaceae bacterium TAV5]|nr:hypothetical protein OPIT5_12430 [Opitutaceae bacterium TAV5]